GGGRPSADSRSGGGQPSAEPRTEGGQPTAEADTAPTAPTAEADTAPTAEAYAAGTAPTAETDTDGWVTLGEVDPTAGDAPFEVDGDAWEHDEAAERAALAAAAEEFGVDLDDDDLAEASGQALPVVAVIGRPNVGKSTLVNRILGRREAVVQDVPGVTRDRVAYEAEWSGHRFVLLDTGGWDPNTRGMAAQIAAQAEVAVAQSDAVVLVVDATVGATDSEEAVVKVLRRAGKPVVLAANKVDDARAEADAAMLWSLGLGEPYPVSALHGRGSGDLLDAVLEVLPAQGSGRSRGAGPRRIALVGKPNVGKSSLLNKVAGQQRAVVSEVAGTTVDPVDEVVVLRDREFLFVDTAGIRRRVRVASGHEYYASLRTHAALEKAEVAVVLVDGGEPMSEQDLRITSMVVESGRAMVLAINKWDLVDEERRRYLEREIERDLAPVAWAPRVNVSALTGRAVDKLVPAIDAALAGWETRVSTGRLNQFLEELVAAHPHPLRGGKQPRILFGTQASTRPPTFVLFTSGFLEAGYRRFVERRLREEFGFVGTPIRINLRIREKRGANR
ncbi:MAG: ribosome biogenesis GTPase Der, partial [Candidatus Nanopelagicales bacterium]